MPYGGAAPLFRFLAVVGMIILGATTGFFDAIPVFIRGMIFLGVCCSLASGVIITEICLCSRLWRMAAIQVDCVAAATTFLVVPDLGSLGWPYPRTIVDALRAIGCQQLTGGGLAGHLDGTR